jgi:uncharacterized membrane protein
VTWIALALLAAVSNAASNLTMKRAVGHGGVLTSTVAYRGIAGLVLAALTAIVGWPELTAAYWRTVALVMPPECVGVVCMMIALRAGEFSEVQPIMGTVPLFVTLGGAAVLREVPTPAAALGVAVLTTGLYTVGLRAGEPWLQPLRSLARSRASWFALAAAVCFSITGVLHKVGIAEVGPFPWATTLSLGSAMALAVSLPVVRRWAAPGASDVGHDAAWVRLVLAAAGWFAVQQAGLQLALGATKAAYVISLTATSVVFSSILGILVLGERQAAAHRLLGAALVSTGAAMIALGG